MNIFVGGWSGWPWLYDNQYKIHHEYWEVRDPSKLFTFIEMPAASINSGNFRVVPLKYGEKDMFSMDWPGVYHNNGSVISFVDGHVEFKRWLEEATRHIPLEAGSPNTTPTGVESEDNRDLAWLRERAIVPYPNDHRWYGIMGGIGRYNRPENSRVWGGKTYTSWGWYWNSSW
jgi:prepilin-type processing-associated H-X9-DG protein